MLQLNRTTGNYEEVDKLQSDPATEASNAPRALSVEKALFTRSWSKEAIAASDKATQAERVWAANKGEISKTEHDLVYARENAKQWEGFKSGRGQEIAKESSQKIAALEQKLSELKSAAPELAARKDELHAETRAIDAAARSAAAPATGESTAAGGGAAGGGGARWVTINGVHVLIGGK